MSPPPFRTSTWSFHAGGSFAVTSWKAACCDRSPGPGRLRNAAKAAAAAASATRPSSRTRFDGSNGFGGTGRPASSRASRWSTPSADAYTSSVVRASSAFANR